MTGMKFEKGRLTRAEGRETKIERQAEHTSTQAQGADMTKLTKDLVAALLSTGAEGIAWDLSIAVHRGDAHAAAQAAQHGIELLDRIHDGSAVLAFYTVYAQYAENV
jgi:hypothetical protein